MELSRKDVDGIPRQSLDKGRLELCRPWMDYQYYVSNHSNDYFYTYATISSLPSSHGDPVVNRCI